MKPLKILALAVSLVTPVAARADIAEAQTLQAQTGALDTYRNVLPLEGGSNFRDLGGYVNEDGKTVRRGLLYRSGVMTGLTDRDEGYLAGFGFETVVDLRSSEERELYPNRWVKDAGVDYISVDYSMMDMMKAGMQGGGRPDMATLYKSLPYSIQPQLKQYFAQAVAGHAPLVVNCSAGQDRTGIASALMLTALDVPRSRIVQDYVLSTEYRRPAVERGSVDLGEAAETNAFAKMMLRYADREHSMAAPLITEEGVPYLVFALQQIEADYGSVLAFMDEELGVGEKEIAALKQQYLR
ncbi:tyrosine-protein phosphatase [Parahaliea aestuarii]|uniref:Tyrosine-protein phosphatase n=1 Tax=Parahaliea aestuarii TaxID=1852021 RepID=A0A5C8ZY42_9GAMM|nr:tyrosine-protein phosphatase [Parahaliea aestuarii]TXS93485.1 tyrosine-protein phosphatase [Parahaliea aestuarii]